MPRDCNRDVQLQPFYHVKCYALHGFGRLSIVPSHLYSLPWVSGQLWTYWLCHIVPFHGALCNFHKGLKKTLYYDKLNLEIGADGMSVRPIGRLANVFYVFGLAREKHITTVHIAHVAIGRVIPFYQGYHLLIKFLPFGTGRMPLLGMGDCPCPLRYGCIVT